MATLEGLRRRIEGAEDLEAIVTAMKSISAVRIRQFQKAVAALGDYGDTVELGLQICLRHETPEELLVHDRSGPVVAIILGADRGLAGQFNNRIVGFAREHLGELTREGLHCFTVGTRLAERLEGEGVPVAERFPAASTVEGVSAVVQDVLLACERWRTVRGVDGFSLFYNAYRGGASYESRSTRLLPMDPDRLRELGDQPWRGPSLPTFPTEWAPLFAALLREHLFVSIFQACAESVASENASRLAAMEAAEARIDERLEELQRAFSQQRHQTITEELLEIISGFEALRHDERRAGSDEHDVSRRSAAARRFPGSEGS